MTCMRTLARARAVARGLHSPLAPKTPDLFLKSVRAWLMEHHPNVSLEERTILRSDAEIETGEVVDGKRKVTINFCHDLRCSSAKLRVAIAHELGHLLLHPRFTEPGYFPLGESKSEDLEHRESRFDWEEEEARVVEDEALCPCTPLFARWQAEPAVQLEQLAKEYAVPPMTVMRQLMRALRDLCEPKASAVEAEPACSTEQLLAAHTTERIGVLDAGPGTGKTRVLVERTRWLLGEKSIRADQLLLVSHGNAAVDNMRDRISGLHAEASKVSVMTVHGLALEIVRKHWHDEELGFTKCPSTLDEAGSRRQLKKAVESAAYAELVDPFHFAKSLSDLTYDLAKVEPGADVQISASSSTGVRRANLLRKLKAELREERRKNNIVDFDDMLYYATLALSNVGNAKTWSAAFPYVLVDEWQDLSVPSLALLLRVVGQASSLFLAGDHRQRIFAFDASGARAGFDSLTNHGLDAKRFSLTKNYRATRSGVDALNRFVGRVAPAERSKWASAAPISLRTMGSSRVGAVIVEEARSIRVAVARVADLVEERIKGTSAKLRDVVVLTRNNLDSRRVVRELRERSVHAFVPAALELDNVAGDVIRHLERSKLSEREREARRTLASTRSMPVGPTQKRDSLRAIFQSSLTSEKEEAGELSASVESAFEELALCVFEYDSNYLRAILSKPDPIRQIEVAQIAACLQMALGHHRIRTAETHCHWVAEMLRGAAMTGRAQQVARGEAINAVQVMTIHQAKGREFGHVIALLNDPPQGRDVLNPGLSKGWDDTACNDFVALSRSKDETDVVLVKHQAVPRSWLTAFSSPSFNLPFKSKVTVEFSRRSLWNPSESLSVSWPFGGFSWCPMQEFLRASFDKGNDLDRTSENLPLKEALHRSISSLLAAADPDDDDLIEDRAKPWANQLRTLARTARAELLRMHCESFERITFPTICVDETEIQVPIVSIAKKRAGEAPVIVLFLGFVCEAAQAVDNELLSALAFLLRAYEEENQLPACAYLVIHTGEDPVAGHVQVNLKNVVLSGEYTLPEKVSKLIRGSVETSYDTKTCETCHCRELCPAYQLPSLSVEVAGSALITKRAAARA